MLFGTFGVFLFSLLYSMDMFGQSPALLKQMCCISSLEILLTCVSYQYGLLGLSHSWNYIHNVDLKNGNNADFAVLFDVDYSIMGEFEGQAAVTESGAV